MLVATSALILIVFEVDMLIMLALEVILGVLQGLLGQSLIVLRRPNVLHGLLRARWVSS